MAKLSTEVLSRALAGRSSSKSPTTSETIKPIIILFGPTAVGKPLFSVGSTRRASHQRRLHSSLQGLGYRVGEGDRSGA